MSKYQFLLLFFILNVFTGALQGQGFLHTQGKNIVDADGNNFLTRSIGTGNWMIQEGYMMGTAGVAATQHEFREKLVELIGVEKTDSFYVAWLDNHFTRRDVDSLAAWGFNTVRPALHYKWFTLPIEEEPVAGEQTWIETGFRITDSLVKWCSENEMYVILDMHGAPGGQGKNADISDYDPDKPSLWESNANKTKLTALWYELAKRYSDHPWVGGYDLVNETNWTFPEGNNSQMRELFIRITDTIRLVDDNHIIFIEGNWFANDFTSLTPPWDENMVYSFHKYWGYNKENSLDWVTRIRDQYNVPLWLGETGENSNTWFTNMVRLVEGKNIGWSFWPVKKAGINNPVTVHMNQGYADLLDYWKNGGSKPDTVEAFEAVLGFAENHRIENCEVNYDVIDALFRQPETKEIRPFDGKKTPYDLIFFCNYDLGRNGYAYFDKDTGDYHLETDVYTAWNKGYSYRNDGVDIEACFDNDTTCGYSVGWTSEGEWLVYTIESDSAVLVDAVVRTASAVLSKLVIEVNDEVASEAVLLSSTGGWSNWSNSKIENILIPEGLSRLKVRIVDGAVNLNYIKFENHRESKEQLFRALYAETAEADNEVRLYVNKEINSLNVLSGDFKLFSGTEELEIEDVSLSEMSSKVVLIKVRDIMLSTANLTLEYTGNAIRSDGQLLDVFTNLPVENRLMYFPRLPAKLQAENYYRNYGFELEDCSDVGGGKNTAYANPGDYLDYLVYVDEEKEFNLTMRVALNNGYSKLRLQAGQNGEFSDLREIVLQNTGGWQSWENQEYKVSMPSGKYIFRIKVLTGEHNLNWFKFSPALVVFPLTETRFTVYPNPFRDYLKICKSEPFFSDEYAMDLIDANGRLMERFEELNDEDWIDLSSFPVGIYFVRLRTEKECAIRKVLKCE